jgi:hypothetical protein
MGAWGQMQGHSDGEKSWKRGVFLMRGRRDHTSFDANETINFHQGKSFGDKAAYWRRVRYRLQLQLGHRLTVSAKKLKRKEKSSLG